MEEECGAGTGPSASGGVQKDIGEEKQEENDIAEKQIEAKTKKSSEEVESPLSETLEEDQGKEDKEPGKEDGKDGEEKSRYPGKLPPLM